MLLKFGQIVDLEKLEVLSSNPVIDEKKQQLRGMEQQGSKELTVLDSKIEEKRRELVAMVRDNTFRLNRMHDLITTMKAMEERLDIRQKSMVSSVLNFQFTDQKCSMERWRHSVAIMHPSLAA